MDRQQMTFDKDNACYGTARLYRIDDEEAVRYKLQIR